MGHRVRFEIDGVFKSSGLPASFVGHQLIGDTLSRTGFGDTPLPPWASAGSIGTISLSLQLSLEVMRSGARRGDVELPRGPGDLFCRGGSCAHLRGLLGRRLIGSPHETSEPLFPLGPPDEVTPWTGRHLFTSGRF